MKFEELLKLQKYSKDLKDIHAEVVSKQVLNPRSRTEDLLQKAQEAIDCFTEHFESWNSYLQIIQSQYLKALEAAKQSQCLHVFEQHLEDLNQLEIQKSRAFQRQQAKSTQSLHELEQTAQISDVLAPLRDINQYDSLHPTIQSKIQAESFPFVFRILSRKNENYGHNSWNTLPPNFNNPETLYPLLTGDFDDAYLSDLEPFQRYFIQGKAGSFIFNRNGSFPSGYNGAEGSAPLAAMASFSLENTSDSKKSCSLALALSSFNFAGVFLKTEAWTPLFQTTRNLVHSEAIRADFTLLPSQKATVLLVSTPYFYRESHLTSGRDRSYWTYNSHALQHLQLSFFNIREVLACLSH